MRRTAAAVALLLAASRLPAEERGEAEVALQGYYLGGNSQALTDTSGLAFRFRYFLPNVGFLSGSFEGYGSQGKLQTGNNFIELRGVPWAGRHWTFTGGDFRLASSVVEFPFFNMVYPEVMARGFKVETWRGRWQYAAFYGAEMLMAGARVPFRIEAPQKVMGATARYKVNSRLQIGFRLLRLSTSPRQMEESPFLFSAGREFFRLDQVSAQSLFTATRALKFFAEAARSLGEERAETFEARRVPLSAMAGAVYETPRLTLRANYAHQGVRFLPLAGYFAGDRRGPYSEARFRPFSRLELFASASRTGNNLERNPELYTFTSTARTGGVALNLPWKFMANAQVSEILFSSVAPETGEERASRNRQLSAGVSRRIGRHSLRFNARELRLVSFARAETQKIREAEDFISFGRYFVGGAVRLQGASSEERRKTLFFRGSAQARFAFLTFYGNVEAGNDLVNRTLFATSAYNTTAAGVSARIGRHWTLQLDTFNNRLVQDLNPESVFVMESRGVGLTSFLSRFDQWSVFFRLTRQLHWGGAIPAEAVGQLVTGQAPLVGSVEGTVRERGLGGEAGVAGVTLVLDDARTTTTDAEGRFRFSEVPEGPHRVALGTRDLPAEFDPGPASEARLIVENRRIARADLDVVRLSAVHGKVSGPEGAPLAGILIRLLPTARYTTTDAEGAFAFYNLREGDYDLALEPSTLPPDAAPASPARIPLAVRLGSAPPEPRFDFVIRKQEKPIRRVLVQ